ncbi:hypothetical protein [Hydrogenimonas sp. SS33]|uniref:hypothetical protein n=1 Tax=Hydrogenimonas leucolamina TaxID=2954236 RepID=UPI00336BB33E
MKKVLPALLLLAAGLFGEIRVGDSFPKVALPDQFGKVRKVTSKDKMVLIAFEKKLFLAMNRELKQEKEDVLKAHSAKVIADISGMPAFIAKMFALPKMRTYPFGVLLIRDGLGKRFDRRKGKITLYTLQHRKVRSIRFLTPEEVGTILQKP